MARLRVPAARASELVRAFQDRARLVDDADGFVDLEVWQSDRDPSELIMVSRWRDRAAFRDYMRSEAHKISHSRVHPDLDAAISLQALEHLHSYRVVAT
jgi:heme-degrading monooxygenase HmoA